jgi:hypothetical protein
VHKHLRVISAGKALFELLDELYNYLGRAGHLRHLADPVSTNTVSIRRAVQNGELERALHVFAEFAVTVQEEETATILLSQYHELKTAQQQYDLTNEQFWEKSQNLKFRLLNTLEKYAYAL